MQQAVFDRLLHAAGDKRLHSLVLEFYETRGGITLLPEGGASSIGDAIHHLIDVIRIATTNHYALRRLTEQDPAAAGEDEAIRQRLDETMGLLDAADTVLCGPALLDAAAALHLVRAKLIAAEDAATGAYPDEASVLAEIDRILSVLGFGDALSVAALWERAGTDLGSTDRTLLWSAVTGALDAARRFVRPVPPVAPDP